MATTAAFDQSIPVFAQLIPISQKIIPMPFHEILFSSYHARIVFVDKHLNGYHGNSDHFLKFEYLLAYLQIVGKLPCKFHKV